MPTDTSVYKRTGRNVWHISYWCAQRMKRLHRATVWRIDDPAGHKHALTFAQAKSAESKAFRGVAKAEVWSAWVTAYLETRYRRQAKTLQRYQGAWAWLRVYFEENAILHPQALTYTNVIDYISWRQTRVRHCGKLISKNTAIVEAKVLGVVMREAVRRGFAATNPCIQLGMHRDAPPEKPEITDEESALIRRLLAEKESALPIAERWMSTSFAIASAQGCRLSETQIPMSAIDLVRGTLRISGKGKNGVAKVYTTRIHPSLTPLLEELKDSGAVTTCFHPQMASKHFHTFFKAKAELAHLCFHCTRVTVITKMARAGVPIQQAMAYVGHASQAVHRIYQRLNAADLSLCTAAI